MNFSHILRCLLLSCASIMLTACEGLFDGVYDDPSDPALVQKEGVLYIDASDWLQWHYIDFNDVAYGRSADKASAWKSCPIPLDSVGDSNSGAGVYTYWYDIYGEGVGKHEFRSFVPTAPQPEPEAWSIAIHRNNVRTNGGAACATSYKSVDDVPSDPAYLESLEYNPDTWNETDVWTIQDRMLLGIIGNQGIAVNEVLSSWLSIEIPPMPPAFTIHPTVFVVRLDDGTYAALQLRDYMDGEGKKCCLTINYRYPL